MKGPFSGKEGAANTTSFQLKVMQAITKPGTANTWLFAFPGQGAKLALIHK